METQRQNAPAFLCAYTRKPRPGRYPAGLAHSLHLAWSLDGRHFTALHQNCGVLFAQGEILANDTILPKGLSAPWLFHIAGEGCGIAAVPVKEDGGVDVQDFGRVWVWKTRDFLRFEGPCSIFLPVREAVAAIQIRYEELQKIYHVLWMNEKGDAYSASAHSLSGLANAAAEPAVWEAAPLPEDLPEDAVAGSCIEIGRPLMEQICGALDRMQAVSVCFPDMVAVAEEQDLCRVKAQVLYSDGSSMQRTVEWNLSQLDFEKSGVYPVRGVVRRPFTGFPLARGFADPVVFPWNGKYYFISTNDNTDCVGLFIREAESVEALFSPDTPLHEILSYAPEKGFVQTFWAPELHEIGGQLYILFAVGGEVWGPQCHMMRLKPGGRLCFPDDRETPVRVCLPDGSPLGADGITLDMSYIKAGAGSYLVWSYRRHIGSPLDTGSMLYIAKADERMPWRLAGKPALLSRPLFGWENCEHTINNEGPYAFLRNGRVYLCYSGGAADSYSYAVGLLTADAQADLDDPSVWDKACAPVISYTSVDGEYGPGHASFFTDEDGNLMIAYHAVEGFDRHVRCTGIRRIHFDIQGRPVFDLSAGRDLDESLCRVETRVKVVK